MLLLAQGSVLYESFDVTSRAQFPGGDYGLQKYIGEHTICPAEALEKDIMGKVMLMFTIDTEGRIVDLKNLDTTVHHLLVAEGFRVIQSTNGMWTPVIKENEKVRMLYRIPINFGMNIQEENEKDIVTEKLTIAESENDTKEAEELLNILEESVALEDTISLKKL